MSTSRWRASHAPQETKMRTDESTQRRSIVGETELQSRPLDDGGQCAVMDVRNGREQVMGGMCIGSARKRGGQHAGWTPVNRGDQRMLRPVVRDIAISIVFRKQCLLCKMRSNQQHHEHGGADECHDQNAQNHLPPWQWDDRDRNEKYNGQVDQLAQRKQKMCVLWMTNIRHVRQPPLPQINKVLPEHRMHVSKQEYQRRIEMLKTMILAPGLVGRQSEKGRIVDIDVTSVNVGESVVGLDVPQSPQIGI